LLCLRFSRGDHEDFYLLRCDAVQSGENLSKFWRNRQKIRVCLLPASCFFFTWLTIRPWKWKRYITPKHRLTFTGLHYVISQKMELFKERFFVFPKHSMMTAYPTFTEKALDCKELNGQVRTSLAKSQVDTRMQHVTLNGSQSRFGRDVEGIYSIVLARNRSHQISSST
jgi:hypothetical protein